MSSSELRDLVELRALPMTSIDIKSKSERIASLIRYEFCFLSNKIPTFLAKLKAAHLKECATSLTSFASRPKFISLAKAYLRQGHKFIDAIKIQEFATASNILNPPELNDSNVLNINRWLMLNLITPNTPFHLASISKTSPKQKTFTFSMRVHGCQNTILIDIDMNITHQVLNASSLRVYWPADCENLKRLTTKSVSIDASKLSEKFAKLRRNTKRVLVPLFKLLTHDGPLEECIAQMRIEFEAHMCVRALVINPGSPDRVALNEHIDTFDGTVQSIEQGNPFPEFVFDELMINQVPNSQYLANSMQIYSEKPVSELTNSDLDRISTFRKSMTILLIKHRLFYSESKIGHIAYLKSLRDFKTDIVRQGFGVKKLFDNSIISTLAKHRVEIDLYETQCATFLSVAHRNTPTNMQHATNDELVPVEPDMPVISYTVGYSDEQVPVYEDTYIPHEPYAEFTWTEISYLLFNDDTTRGMQ
ncbi:hypothetical protein GCM10011607_29000 [Shewanella inventionis]|uniref:Uncharacterized protein n=1 Tax=Shewanella inventionis TaxID=1738770 RepID=A0ABQ1JGF5_9GAMM|nr:hypothetical protein [Shewanella inventionis]GGB66570.1 hypothetical protein GCM10011607_29000 [Shewanella inventionis]